MINKIAPSVEAALAGTPDGATVLIGGFGTAGIPDELIDGLIAQGARDLTVVNNNAGNGDHGLAALLATGRVRKVICSFPRQADSHVFDGLYRSGKIELELVPQGNLAERLRAAGAGIGVKIDNHSTVEAQIDNSDVAVEQLQRRVIAQHHHWPAGVPLTAVLAALLSALLNKPSLMQHSLYAQIHLLHAQKPLSHSTKQLKGGKVSQHLLRPVINQVI